MGKKSIKAGRPWENGYNDSSNGKLREAQILVEQWRREYNTIRPPSSMGYRPTAQQAIRPSGTWLRRPVLQGPGPVPRLAARLT